MVAALSYAFSEDLRSEFESLNFPIDDGAFERLYEMVTGGGASLLPSTAVFGVQDVGSTSAGKSFTLTNYLLTPISISASFSGANPKDFPVQPSSTCPYPTGTLAANSSCTYVIAFAPSVKGAENSAFSVTETAQDVTQPLASSPQVINLSGTGASAAAAPVASVSPGSLNFGIQLLSTTSAAQTVTVSNSGTASVTLTTIAIAGANSSDFSQNNNCPISPNTFAPGASCQVSATFSPTASGPRKSAIKISGNSGNSVVVVLTGVGTAVGLSPASLSFPSQSVGSGGTPQTVTLSNLGSRPINLWQMALRGTNAADFSKSSTCGSTLAAGSSCGITVTFTPSAAGTRSASLLISDDGGGSPQSVSLSGTGI
jgi:hypothetical protein